MFQDYPKNVNFSKARVFRLIFLLSRQLFKYGKKKQKTTGQNFAKNLLTGAFKCLWECPASKASRISCTTATNSTSFCRIILACLSSVCNMTSSRQFPFFQHQRLSEMVLSGTQNQEFSKQSLNVHSDVFPISNKFQVTVSQLYYTDIDTETNSCLEGEKPI